VNIINLSGLVSVTGVADAQGTRDLEEEMNSYGRKEPEKRDEDQTEAVLGISL
jgi:hypothetical protein